MVKVMPVGVCAAAVGLASAAGVMVTPRPLMELTSVTLLTTVLPVKVAVSVTLTRSLPCVIVGYKTDDPDGQAGRRRAVHVQPEIKIVRQRNATAL